MARSRPDGSGAATGLRAHEIACGIAAAFAFNWIWENAQAFLFAGYRGFWPHLGACTIATLGDVLFVSVIHAAVALAWRDSAWHRRSKPAHHAVAVIAGVVIAATVELRAVATGRWAYEGMPLIPLTGIGVLPILQMVALPSAVFWLMRRVATDKT